MPIVHVRELISSWLESDFKALIEWTIYADISIYCSILEAEYQQPGEEATRENVLDHELCESMRPLAEISSHISSSFLFFKCNRNIRTDSSIALEGASVDVTSKDFERAFRCSTFSRKKILIY